MWTLPTIAALLSYLWYKRKRIGAPSDPGGEPIEAQIDAKLEQPPIETDDQSKDMVIPPKDEEKIASSPISVTPKITRSLSGIETSPIDIVVPKELRSIKQGPVHISDEDLDFEIEKVKSMKTTTAIEAFNKVRSDSCSPKKSELETSPVKTETKPFECKKPSPDLKPEVQKQETLTKKEIRKNRKMNSKTYRNMAEVGEKLSKLNCSSKSADPKENRNKNLEENRQAVADKKSKSGKKLDRKNQSESRSNANSDNQNRREDLQRQSSERDSANHSPAEVMLASPSLSSISDNHSEGSNDSGKGGSDVVTPPPSRTPGPNDSHTSQTLYEFTIPQSLVGRLIGKRGAIVQHITERSGAQITIRRHPVDNVFKVCSLEGTSLEIDKALQMIRDRFPIKKFPEITLDSVAFNDQQPTVSLVSDLVYLKLVEGVNNDTIMSCLVTPSHLFLQQPAHPTYPSLQVLANCMNLCYSDPTLHSPMIPKPVPENTVCAAFSVDSWYRAMILSTDEESDTSYVKFLDYGGYAYVENALLRQIRGDFMLLPFQAAECFLSNIKPIGGDNAQWLDEAYTLVAEITKGAIVFTQVVEYTEDDMPLVNCYVVIGPNQFIFLNQELVNNGFAEWITYPEFCIAENPQCNDEIAELEEPAAVAV